MVTVTRLQVQTNMEEQPLTGVSTQEADTLMMLHAAEICATGKSVHIMMQDTDVLVLTLRRLPTLGPRTTMLMGTGDKRRKVLLQHIYDSLGPEKVAALPGFHCITGCDTCGHIRGKGKKTAFKVFNEAIPEVINALAQLGIAQTPPTSVISGCEKFLCRLMSNKTNLSLTAGNLRWKHFKNQSAGHGIEKIPPTAGAWYQHILRAHMQAFIWNHDLVEDPPVPDPCKLGWSRAADGILVPVLSEVPTAPKSVVELVKCGCGSSICSRRSCTEVCKCEAVENCVNTNYRDQELEEGSYED